MITQATLVHPNFLGRCNGVTTANLLPGVNLCVGPNGSGKSTFLSAIARQVNGDFENGKPLATLIRNAEVPVIYHSSEEASGVAAHDQKLQDTVAGRSGVAKLGNNYMSFGQRLMHLLSELKNVKTPHVVILDEPEIALDFDAVYAFCQFCAEMATVHQFIISTHHPLFFTMKTANFVVFGDDKKYPNKVVAKMRKRLA